MQRAKQALAAVVRRARAITPTQLAFGVPAVAVVAISAVFSMRGAAVAAPEPDRFSGSRVVMRMATLLPAARLSTPVVVAIVRDPESANFYDSPATLDSIIAAWRRPLQAAGATVRVVSPGAIRGANARVLLVPSSPCLTVATREAMDMAGARGQGLIVSGPTGTHDAGCRSLGYGLLVALTGAARAEPVRGRPMVYATIPAGTPLAADLPPGARLDISPASQVALRTRTRDLFYSDYSLGAEPLEGAPYLDAAAVRSEYRGARVVYFGFEPRDVGGNAWHRDLLRVLARNAVAWAAGIPVATSAPWPRGYRSAAVIAQDVEQGFASARHALDSLEAAGVRSTFFVTSDIARDHRRLTRAMAENGEVGTHTENHDLLGGTSFERQLARLEATRTSLGKLVDGKVSGLRPPEEQFDEATMAAWVRAGGTYLLGANGTRCASPELLRVKGDTLVLLPRAFSDDFIAAGPEYRRAPHLVTAVMRSEMQRADAVGGLYVLSYHSQLLARAEYVGVVAELARELSTARGVWLATAGDVADWWRRRAALRVSITSVTASQVELEVHNRGTVPMDNAVAAVTIPPGRRVQPSASVEVREGTAFVSLQRVAAGSRIRVRLNLGS